MKIEIKSIWGSILFEYDCENNSLLKTLLKAKSQDANLCDADLRGANLCDADLRGADLRGANLCDADLRGADSDENTAMFSLACPEEGEFIAFKKCQGKIVKLLVLSDAKRSSATTLKCRCSKAKVLEIQEKDGTKSSLTEIRSDRNSKFIYKIDEIATVDNFDEDRWKECSTGIHFFLSRQVAVNY